MRYKYFTSRLLSMALVLAIFPALAQTERLSIATFNAGWWTTSQEFTSMHSQCSDESRRWCSTRSSVASCKPTDKGIPPCSAYVQYDKNLPLFTPTLSFWDARREALRRTLARTAPDVLALQEVSSMEAARELFTPEIGKQFSFCESAHRDPANPEAQRLVIAARTDVVKITSCQTDQSLAVEDEFEKGHFTRPALVAELATAKGVKWTVAVVHLKSGCASPAGNERYDFRGSYLDTQPKDLKASDRQNAERNSACLTLRKQVAPLERLIHRETAGGAYFVLLGDFNRKLHLELNSKSGMSRADSENARGIPADSDRVRLLWPEVNDGDPTESLMTLVRREPRKQLCADNEGLDHIAFSGAFSEKNRNAMGREVELAGFGYNFLASDHCPLVMQLIMP